MPIADIPSRRDSTTEALENAIREITEALQRADGRIVYVYVHPSHAKKPKDPVWRLTRQNANDAEKGELN